MIHSVETVARNRFLDLGVVTRVAQTSKNVFHAHGKAFVNTFWVNDFVEEVIEAQGGIEASKIVRQREIDKQRKG